MKHTHILRVIKTEEKQKDRKTFEEITAENFPNLKTKHIYIAKKSKTLPSRIHTREIHIQTNQTQSVKLLFSCQVMSDSF